MTDRASGLLFSSKAVTLIVPGAIILKEFQEKLNECMRFQGASNAEHAWLPVPKKQLP